MSGVGSIYEEEKNWSWKISLDCTFNKHFLKHQKLFLFLDTEEFPYTELIVSLGIFLVNNIVIFVSLS